MRTTRYRSAGGAGGSGTPTECTPTAVFAETFGIDDFLKIIYSLPYFDTFAVTEDVLGVKVGLFDTVGVDDRLTLTTLTTRFVDTFGADDRLTLATIIGRYVDSFGFDDALTVVLKPIFADTFGNDDVLTLVTLISHYVDTVGVTDNFATTIQLFDTFGVDDRLTFADLLATYADTFGVDDGLTSAVLLTYFIDTFGMDDRLAFVDVFTNHPDTFAVTEDALGVTTTLFDTQGNTDDLLVDLLAGFTELQIASPSFFVWSSATNAWANWMKHYAETPDTVPLSITSDITLKGAVASLDYTSGTQTIIAKHTAAPNNGWAFGVDGSGNLFFFWSATGTGTASFTSSVSLTTVVSDGAGILVAVTFDVVDGANKSAKFWYKTFTEDTVRADLQSQSGWTQLGTTQTTAGTTSLVNGNSPVTIGNAPTLGLPFGGFIYGAIIETGLMTGSAVFDWLSADATSTYGDVTEIANSAVVSVHNEYGYNARYIGFGPSTFDVLKNTTLEFLIKSRSGTPDSDLFGDGWIDQAAATTNHGNETPLIVKGKSTLANDERRAFLKFGRTILSADFRANVGMNFVLLITNTDILSAVIVTIDVRRGANPFTESTLTWNTPTAGGPVSGTLIKTVTESIAANSTETVAVSLTLAETDALFNADDAWTYLRITGPGAVAPVTVQIASRENATAASKPRMNMYMRGL